MNIVISISEEDHAEIIAALWDHLYSVSREERDGVQDIINRISVGDDS